MHLESQTQGPLFRQVGRTEIIDFCGRKERFGRLLLNTMRSRRTFLRVSFAAKGGPVALDKTVLRSMKLRMEKFEAQNVEGTRSRERS